MVLEKTLEVEDYSKHTHGFYIKKLEELFLEQKRDSSWLRSVKYYTRHINLDTWMAQPDKKYMKKEVLPVLKKAREEVKKSKITGDHAEYKDWEAWAIGERIKGIEAYIEGKMPPKLRKAYRYLPPARREKEKREDRNIARKVRREFAKREPSECAKLMKKLRSRKYREYMKNPEKPLPADFFES